MSNINAGNLDAAVESFAEDCQDHDPEPGRAGFRAFFAALAGIPRAQIEPAHVVVDDEQVRAAYTLSSGPAQKGRADTCRLQIAPGD